MPRLDPQTQILQMIATYEACIAASDRFNDVVRVIRTSGYEDIDEELSSLLGCSLGAAREVRHLSLDRLTPHMIQRLREELPALREELAKHVGA
jgi:hypothetical protein